MKQINRNEVFALQPDGSSILISFEEVEIDTDDLIADKEQQLLDLYNELLELKKKKEAE